MVNRYRKLEVFERIAIRILLVKYKNQFLEQIWHTEHEYRLR